MPDPIDARVHPYQRAPMHSCPDLGLGDSSGNKVGSAHDAVAVGGQPGQFHLHCADWLSHISS
jgi:Putative nuclear localisation signal of quaking